MNKHLNTFNTLCIPIHDPSTFNTLSIPTHDPSTGLVLGIGDLGDRQMRWGRRTMQQTA